MSSRKDEFVEEAYKSLKETAKRFGFKVISQRTLLEIMDRYVQMENPPLSSDMKSNSESLPAKAEKAKSNDLSFEEVIKRNEENRKRLEKERLAKNKSIVSTLNPRKK